MKRLLLLGASVLLAACGDDGGGPGPVQPDTAIVSMPGFSFVPFTTTIGVGGTVVFDFPAEPHNVIFQQKPGVPANIQETSSRSVPRTFNSAGDFPYDCLLHPGMSGLVVVTR